MAQAIAAQRRAAAGAFRFRCIPNAQCAIVFIGTGEIGVPVLRLLLESAEHELVGVVTQPDKPVGRDQKLTPPPIKAARQQLSVASATPECELEVPIFQPARIKRERRLRQFAL